VRRSFDAVGRNTSNVGQVKAMMMMTTKTSLDEWLVKYMDTWVRLVLVVAGRVLAGVWQSPGNKKQVSCMAFYTV